MTKEKISYRSINLKTMPGKIGQGFPPLVGVSKIIEKNKTLNFKEKSITTGKK